MILEDVSYRAKPTAPDLSLLKDPSKLSNDQLIGLYGSVLEYSHSLIDGLNPSDTSLVIAQSYSERFKEDSSAIWFGLAPYAVAKVGELYTELGAMDKPLSTASKIFDKAAEIHAEERIALAGLFDGNKAIFYSMNSAEMIYQAGGTTAVQAMLGADITFGGAPVKGDNTYEDSLINSFKARDLAKQFALEGNTADAMSQLKKSLTDSADFEQRKVLQQYYDTTYSTKVEGKTYSDTLRNSLNYFTNGVGAVFPDSFVQRFSRVTVLDKSAVFTGKDIGNVDERMPFVYKLAGSLLDGYRVNSGRMAGPERIFWNQQDTIQRTYGTTRYLSTVPQFYTPKFPKK